MAWSDLRGLTRGGGQGDQWSVSFSIMGLSNIVSAEMTSKDRLPVVNASIMPGIMDQWPLIMPQM